MGCRMPQSRDRRYLRTAHAQSHGQHGSGWWRSRWESPGLVTALLLGQCGRGRSLDAQLIRPSPSGRRRVTLRQGPWCRQVVSLQPGQGHRAGGRGSEKPRRDREHVWSRGHETVNNPSLIISKQRGQTCSLLIYPLVLFRGTGSHPAVPGLEPVLSLYYPLSPWFIFKSVTSRLALRDRNWLF